MADQSEIVSGDPRFAKLANDVSDAIAAALKSGMEPDECACVAASVIADYARHVYGNNYLDGLALVVTQRAEHPMPVFETEH